VEQNDVVEEVAAADQHEQLSSETGRVLRKRRINLNRLASSLSAPLVCQFQHCGVQLADGEMLEVSNYRCTCQDHSTVVSFILVFAI
jgi:hypothetical protein